MAYGMILKLTNTVAAHGYLIDDILPSGLPQWQQQSIQQQVYLHAGVGQTLSVPFTDFAALSYSSGKIRKLITAGYVTATFSSTTDFPQKSVSLAIDSFAKTLVSNNVAIAPGALFGDVVTGGNAPVIGYVTIPEKATITRILVSVHTVTAKGATWTLAVKNASGTTLLNAATFDLAPAGGTVVGGFNTAGLTAGVSTNLTLTATAADLNLEAGAIIAVTSDGAAATDFAGLVLTFSYILRD